MNKKLITSILIASALSISTMFADKRPADYVNPFIGTTNFGATNPGAVCPNGLMSVVPFNVMGSGLNLFDKDARWWSTPYEVKNKFLTGFSHVNLSGVGCPDLGSLLVMPTTGTLDVDYTQYGSQYKDEKATPGYYSTTLTHYNVKAEATATLRCGVLRFTFPKGESHILLNLGQGLTNESGATVRKVSDTEIEGSKLLGTFCYNAQAVFPIYFVMQITKKPDQFGYWKKQPVMKAQAQFDAYSGKYKCYTHYTKEMSGDNIGVYYTFNTSQSETVEVHMGVSFVSIKNARENLHKELDGQTFETIHQAAYQKWNKDLSRILVEGNNETKKTVFYTALYHALIHPNILQDVNGQYPAMESDQIKTTSGNRYTVFSLWDTYRNLHQLMTLVYPERQIDMVRSMIDMYKEHGWLPKWCLFGRETYTMEGDPAIPVITDTWMKGLRGFDINLAYQAMYKSATTAGKDNLLRPDIDDYIKRGYVPMTSQYDNSVSHALEYYIADYSLSTLAKQLGKKDDAKLFYNRSMGYKHYFSKQFGTLRPIRQDGKFYSPFNPREGENFAPSPGFHEGSAWNYTFYVPHDVLGLAKLMGGKRAFVDTLQTVFNKGYYDPANEPDIAYPYLFSYFKGEEWRTQKEVTRLLDKYYTNTPDGIPGNDDTGTMSAWAVFSMMGFYPDCPGVPQYTLTTPAFDKVTIHLDPHYYKQSKLTIECRKNQPNDAYIKNVSFGAKRQKGFRFTHDQLVNAGTIIYQLQSKK